MNRLVLTLLLLLLSACASPPIVNRAVIRNDSGREIWNVVLTHKPSEQMGKVSRIQRDQVAEVGFFAQALLAKSAEFHWEDAQGSHRFELPVPTAHAQGAGPFTLEYQILPSHRVEGDLRTSAAR